MKPYIALGDFPRHSKAVIVDMINKNPSLLDCQYGFFFRSAEMTVSS